MIAELDQSGTTVKSHLWGLDLSGTLQGAGGVGGLLATIEGTERYSHTYDGNGNVTAVTKDDGTVAAYYEFDPFGNTTYMTGPIAAANPWRFSTKYLDPETDLYYYGYRYYSPELGRWINRDPIEEKGGLNLYRFVGNDGVNKWDMLGLELTIIGSYNAATAQLPLSPNGLVPLVKVYLKGSGFTPWLNPHTYLKVQAWETKVSTVCNLSLYFTSVFRTIRNQINIKPRYPKAKPGYSLHNAGFAVDIDIGDFTDCQMECIARAAMATGLRWGKSFNDPVHFYEEVPGGLQNRLKYIEAAQEYYKQYGP